MLNFKISNSNISLIFSSKFVYCFQDVDVVVAAVPNLAKLRLSDFPISRAPLVSRRLRESNDRAPGDLAPIGMAENIRFEKNMFFLKSTLS